MPEYKTYLQYGPWPNPNPLPQWYSSRSTSTAGYDLLVRLFDWDPAKRITAREALQHAWFLEEGGCNTK
jgi:cyclin-dependent kinase 8/11